MGLSSFPSASEGLLPVLVMNTVVSVTMLKNMFKSLLQVLAWNPLLHINNNVVEQDYEYYDFDDGDEVKCVARRRMCITQYKCMNDGGARWRTAECCVCLCGFQGSEEVSELSCKHFFHTACLDKWFLNRHTCPLCRSTS